MLLNQTLSEFNIILASGSPRRKQLLADMDIKFTIAARFGVEEAYPPSLDAGEVAWYLSKHKSEAYPCELNERDLLITADTVVVLGDKVLGKPEDRKEAVAMLKGLSGRTHKVVTGVTLRSKNYTKTFSDTTEVSFRELKEEEISYYIDTYQPYDKAGSYGVQEYIGCIGVTAINGSYFNVMGLPTEVLFRQLGLFIEKIKTNK